MEINKEYIMPSNKKAEEKFAKAFTQAKDTLNLNNVLQTLRHFSGEQRKAKEKAIKDWAIKTFVKFHKAGDKENAQKLFDQVGDDTQRKMIAGLKEKKQSVGTVQQPQEDNTSIMAAVATAATSVVSYLGSFFYSSTSSTETTTKTEANTTNSAM
jgi:hypothetical protein